MTCIFLCVTCITKAQEPDWMAVADSLYNKGLYFEASVYCERVLFTSESSPAAASAVLLKIQCYKQQQQYAKAARYIQSVQYLFSSDSLQQALSYETALAYYLAGEFENAIAVTDRAILRYPAKQVQNRANLIRILSLNELRRWPEAAAVYRQYKQSDTIPDCYASLPRLKSEDKAEWLATFIPGAGHFYAGAAGEGLVSIAIQALGIYYGVISWQQKHYISAWLIGGGVFGSFHLGGARRARQLVKNYNNRKAQAFNKAVREQILQ